MVPVGADPLVEFGQSHRILWVKKLDSKTCHIRSIGEGIIGSSSEEESRKQLDWEEGDIYLVKSNGGKAVGWTHCLNKQEIEKSADSTEANNKDSSVSSSVRKPAILISIKIPLNKTSEDESSTSSEDELPNVDDVASDTWASYFRKLSQILLKDDTEHSPGIIKLSEEHRMNVRHAMGKVQHKAPTFPHMPTEDVKVPINSVASIPLPLPTERL